MKNDQSSKPGVFSVVRVGRQQFISTQERLLYCSQNPVVNKYGVLLTCTIALPRLRILFAPRNVRLNHQTTIKSQCDYHIYKPAVASKEDEYALADFLAKYLVGRIIQAYEPEMVFRF